MNANESLQKLKQGNQKYLKALTNSGDISPQIRLKTAQKGQSPFATIIACSDSREIPEAIFSAGIGDLFDIRIAGNVIDDHQLGSIEYAADHLKTPLVVVLGHTHCGAINAAITNHSFGFIKSITDDINCLRLINQLVWTWASLIWQLVLTVSSTVLLMQNGWKNKPFNGNANMPDAATLLNARCGSGIIIALTIWKSLMIIPIGSVQESIKLAVSKGLPINAEITFIS